MQRKDWRGALRRIRLSPAQNGLTTGGGSQKPGRGRQRMGRWMVWGSLVVGALLITGVALSAARNNASLALMSDGYNSQISQNQGPQTGTGSTEARTGNGVVQASTPAMALAEMNPPLGRTDGKQPAQPGSTTQQSQPWDRMVVRTATLGITVKDVGASLDKVRALAGAHGGYVTQTDSHQDGDYTVASITLQVPTREFDGVVSELRKYGVKPAQESSSSSDVTEEYTDLQSQLRNMQATEARVLALMGKAELINDVLTLDHELRDIRGQIEQIQGRINYLGKRSEMSTITVSLSPDSAPVPVKAAKSSDAWDPAQIAGTAWNASLDLLAGVGKVVITGAVFSWWAVPVLLALWIITRPRRRTAPSEPTIETS